MAAVAAGPEAESLETTSRGELALLLLSSLLAAIAMASSPAGGAERRRTIDQDARPTSTPLVHEHEKATQP